MVLNLGSGDQDYGDIRLDKYRGKANVIADLEGPLPFPTDTFDLVYSRWVFEHLRNPGLVLSEMKRVCKRGGRVVIITDNAGSIGQNWPGGAHAGGYVRIARGSEDRHYSLYTLEHMRNHLRRAGLQVVEVKLIHGETGPLQRLDTSLHLTRFFPLLSTFICAHIYAVGRKQDD